MATSVTNASGTASALPSNSAYLLASLQQALAKARPAPALSGASGLMQNLRPLVANTIGHSPVNPFGAGMGNPAKQKISPFAFRSLPDLNVMMQAIKKAGIDFKPEEEKATTKATASNTTPAKSPKSTKSK